MKSGRVSKLLEQTYFLFVCTFLIWGILLSFIDYATGTHLERHKFTKLCMKFSENGSENDSKTTFANVGLSIHMIFTMGYIILYYNAIKYVKKGSQNGQIPVKYGRYQRNVITYKQLMILSVISIICTVSSSLFIQENLFNSLFAFNFIVLFFLGVVFPTYLLITIGNTIPDFHKNITRQKTEFYVIPLKFEPEPREQNFHLVDGHKCIKINRKQFDFDRKMHEDEVSQENEIVLNPKHIYVKPFM